MAIIAELAVLITADTGRFNKGMKQGQAGLVDFARGVAVASVALQAAQKTWEGIKFAGAEVEKTVSRLKDLSGLAQQIGADFKTIQEFEFLGKVKEIGVEEFTQALHKMQVKLGEAAAGSTEAQAAFRKLGLSDRELQFDTAQQAFFKISDAFKQLPTRAQQAAAGQEIFGKASGRLLEILDLGSDGLKQNAQDLKDLGLISEQDGARANELKEQINRLSFAFEASSRAIVVAFLPQLESVIQKAKEAVGVFDLLGKAIGESLNGVALPPNVSSFARQLDEDAQKIDAFEKKIALSGATVFVTQKRIDELTEKMRQLAAASNLPLGGKIKEFSEQAQAIPQEFNRILRSLKSAGDELKVREADFAKAADNLNTIRSEIAAVQVQPVTADTVQELAELREEETKMLAVLRDQEARANLAKDSIQRFGDEARASVQKLDDLEKSAQKFNGALERAARHTKEFRTSAEKFKEDLGELREEFDGGLISAETLRRGIAKLSEEFLKQRQSIGAALAGTKEAFGIETAFLNARGVSGATSAIAERIIAEKRLRDAAAGSAKIFAAIVESTAGIRQNLIDATAALKELNNSAAAQRLQRVPTREEALGRPLAAPPIGGGASPFGPVPAIPEFPQFRQRVPTRDEMRSPPDLLNELQEHGRVLKQSLEELKKATQEQRMQRSDKPKVRELSTIP